MTVAVLIPFPDTDEESRKRRAVLARGLEALGWREGHTLRLEVRYAPGDAMLRQHAAELAALQPNAMIVQSNQAMAIAREQRVEVPIVFVAVSAKWLQVLTEIAPRIERVGMLLNPTIAANRFAYYPPDGGLVAYGIDVTEAFRLAATYVDRILKGARPAELPVQLPTKYEW